MCRAGAPIWAGSPGWRFRLKGIETKAVKTTGTRARRICGCGRQWARVITRCDPLSDRPDWAHDRVTIKTAPGPAEQPEVHPACRSSFPRSCAGRRRPARQSAAGHLPPLILIRLVPAALIGGGIGTTPMTAACCDGVSPTSRSVVHLDHRPAQQRRARLQAARGTCRVATAPRSEHRRQPPAEVRPTRARRSARRPCGRRASRGARCRMGAISSTSGPPMTMQALVPALAAWGVPVADIHYEAFGPASSQAPGRARSHRIGRRRGRSPGSSVPVAH